MKTTFSFFFLMALVFLASGLKPSQAFSAVPSAGQEESALTKARDEKLRWLYEKLFSLDIRSAQPTEVWRSFRVHLEDTSQEFPDPSVIQQAQLMPLKPVRGMITYIGMFQKKYVYDVFLGPDGAVVLKVKVHLKNPTPEDMVAFTQKVKSAEEIWNQYRIPADFVYRFEFEVVKTAEEAPFSVTIKDSTRGPYDQFWSRDWTESTVAHEIGHMMGLGDEYQPVGKAFGCYMSSLMCSSGKGHPSFHHYYFILRRLILPKTDASTQTLTSQE
jgi:hypothetical protein